jgi:hypothetical protein
VIKLHVVGVLIDKVVLHIISMYFFSLLKALKEFRQWCQNASYFVMCSLKFDRENYFHKLVHGLNLVKKLYILYSAHFGTHLFFNLVYTEPSGSHPTQGKALDGNREPALKFAIDRLGNRTPDYWLSWGTLSIPFITRHANM